MPGGGLHHRDADHVSKTGVLKVRDGAKLRSPGGQPAGRLYPQERTSSWIVGMSQKCHKRTKIGTHVISELSPFTETYAPPHMCCESDMIHEL